MVKHVHVAIIAAFVAITCCAGCAGCACANAQTVDETFMEISDTLVSHNVDADEQARFDCLASWHEAKAAREAEEQAAAAAAAAAVDNQGGYYEAEYWEPEYYEPQYGGYSNDFMRDGVRYGEDGTRFTWYSSNAAYHYRTDEWTPDDEGFYRTDDGLYVVASSDYPEGTVISTPWGDGVVLDSGCESGTVDMYTAF